MTNGCATVRFVYTTCGFVYIADLIPGVLVVRNKSEPRMGVVRVLLPTLKIKLFNNPLYNPYIPCFSFRNRFKVAILSIFHKDHRFVERKQSSGFRRIFTVAILLFSSICENTTIPQLLFLSMIRIIHWKRRQWFKLMKEFRLPINIFENLKIIKKKQ